jgi:heterodisulfide reductase subunit D
MTVRLPLADSHAKELETCGYCPKLCRSVCSVSNAEPRESLTPWGKMTTTWLAARGDLPLEPSVAELPYACCGCLRCTGFCKHDNPVAETLFAARAELRERGASPPAVERSYERFLAWHERRSEREGVREAGGAVTRESPLFVIGCSYLRHDPRVATDAVEAAARLFGSVLVYTDCCGLYPREVGDLETSARLRGALEQAASGRRVVTLDAGCAHELGSETLAEAAAREPERLGVAPELAGEARVRYHDPCRASRGRAVTRAPRTVLERALGRAPDEFERRHAESACSGGGGLLPVSFPRISEAIADDRLREHERLGGGLVVTGCASSLVRFRSRGARVLDLSQVLAMSLRSGARR